MIPEFLKSFDLFIRYLEKLPELRLPGLEAQLKMAPMIRKEEISTIGKGMAAVKSAVLFLFYPTDDNSVGTVFIQRAVYKGTHSGQISFPGGRYELSDPGLEYTALRETYEEIGVPVQKVKVIGRLSDLFIPPSKFIVSPFIGTIDEKPDFIADPNEVAKVLEIELRAFFDPINRVNTKIELPTGFSLETPCFSINGYTIWGATAMMVSEFIEIMKKLSE